MTEATDLAEGVRFRGLLLEAADQQHLPQHLEVQLGLRRVLRTAGGGGHEVAASAASAASTCSQALYLERTSGPDSTCWKPSDIPYRFKSANSSGGYQRSIGRF